MRRPHRSPCPISLFAGSTCAACRSRCIASSEYNGGRSRASPVYRPGRRLPNTLLQRRQIASCRRLPCAALLSWPGRPRCSRCSQWCSRLSSAPLCVAAHILIRLINITSCRTPQLQSHCMNCWHGRHALLGIHQAVPSVSLGLFGCFILNLFGIYSYLVLMSWMSRFPSTIDFRHSTTWASWVILVSCSCQLVSSRCLGSIVGLCELVIAILLKQPCMCPACEGSSISSAPHDRRYQAGGNAHPAPR